MRSFGTTAGATAECAGAIVASATGAVSAKQLLLEQLLVFLAKFLLLENYMLSPYIILVSNRLVGWFLMKFLRCNYGFFFVF